MIQSHGTLTSHLLLAAVVALAITGVALHHQTLADQDRGGDVRVAPDSEPTPEETLMLEYVNRGRMDPVSDGARVAQAAREPTWATWASCVDWDLYQEEMSQVRPTQPLVFHPALLKAARRHSVYLSVNLVEQGDSGHREEVGRPGFTGVDCVERSLAAGYPTKYVGENIGYREDIHEGYCLISADYCSTTGDGMYPGREHRKIMHLPQNQEFGFAVMKKMASARSGADASAFATYLFGSHSPHVYAGGVVYEDRNGNDFYDIGEGVGGVEIRLDGGAATHSWQSGAWTLKLLGKGPWRLIARWDDLTWSREIPACNVTVKFDVIRPPEKERKRFDKMLGQLAAEHRRKPDGKKTLKLGLQLDDLGSRTPLDDQRRAALESLTVPAKIRLEKAQDEVRVILTDPEADDASSTVRDLLRTFKGTVAESWFDDAATCAKHWSKVSSQLRELEKLKPDRRERTAATLRAAAKGLNTEEWRSYIEDLAARIAP